MKSVVAIERRRIELDGLAGVGRPIQIERDVRSVDSEEPPADVDLGVAGANRDDAPAEPFHDVLRVGERAGQDDERDRGTESSHVLQFIDLT